jgi:hypothetical protein
MTSTCGATPAAAPPHHVEVERATSYGCTGRATDAAASLWDQIMDSMPDTARRDNAVFRARQSAALAQVPDRAVWAAAEAASAMRATGSARLRREINAIPNHAASWSRPSAGRELRGVVAAVV